jgi:hypothetical protein
LRSRLSELGARGLLLLLLAVGPPGALAAQDESDSTAYRALTESPLNAFSPVLGPSLIPRRRSGVALHARYGLMSFRSEDFIHNFGVGADLPVAAGRLGITAGYYGPACSQHDCPGHFMASAEFEQGLASVALGRPDQSGSLNVGIRVGLGLGVPEDATLVSGILSVPVALVPRSQSTRIFPFLAPGVGVGVVDRESGTDAGMLPMFSAGVGLVAVEERVGVLAGINRAFLKGGNWLAGVSLTWHFDR